MTDTDLKALPEQIWVYYDAEYDAKVWGGPNEVVARHAEKYVKAGTLIPASEVEARVKAEREAIAKEIEDWQLFTKHSQENVTMELANAIRARGDSHDIS